MNRFDSDVWFCAMGITVVLTVLFSSPIYFVIKTVATQQALNKECKTSYNFIQVATAGDNLSRLCQIKQQTITIK